MRPGFTKIKLIYLFSDLILNKTILDDAWSEHNKTIEKEGYMLPISLSASAPIKDMAP